MKFTHHIIKVPYHIIKFPYHIIMFSYYILVFAPDNNPIRSLEILNFLVDLLV